MRPSPDSAFDTWFRKLGFRGRDTLSDLPASLHDQLRALQSMYNEAFERETTFPEYAHTLPLYFNYIDADVENAIATHDDENYAFIGITRQLVFKLSDLCVRLARCHGPVCRELRVSPSPEDYNELQGTLLYILLSFIVAHEWSHHKHGHLAQFSSPGKIFEEVVITEPIGREDDQIRELAADSFAAFLVLAHLFDDRRPTFLPFLTWKSEPPKEALDQVFLALFIVAFAGFMLYLPATGLNGKDVYRLTHPPGPARLLFFVREISAWCSNDRAALKDWIAEHFPALLRATNEAIYSIADFRQIWKDQLQFLQSPEGQQYDQVLLAGINAYKKTWGADPLPSAPLEPPAVLELQLLPAGIDPGFQAAHAQFSAGLGDASISVVTRNIASGVAPGPGVAGAVLLLASTLGPTAIIQLRKLLETYLAHGGRRIKLKNQSVSIECSPEDFQKLFTADQIQQLLQSPQRKAIPLKNKVKGDLA